MIKNFVEYDKLFNPDEHERIIYLYIDNRSKDVRLHLDVVGKLRTPMLVAGQIFPIATVGRLSKIMMDISLRIYEDNTLFQNIDELNHDEIIPFSSYPYAMKKAYVVNLNEENTIGDVFTVLAAPGERGIEWMMYHGGEKNGMRIPNSYIINNKYSLFCLPHNKIEKIIKQIKERNS